MVSSFVSSFFPSDFSRWVIKNKPEEKKSNKIYNQFANKMQIKFDSDENFEAGIKEVVKSCSQLATGAKILQNLIDTNKKITIIHDTQTGYHTCTGRIHFDAFDQDYYYQTYNDDGEIELVKSPLEAIFLHEALHKVNYYINSSAMDKRLKTRSWFSEDMENQEEELVIRGKIKKGSACFKYCSENKVLKEMGYSKRITHMSVKVPKNAELSIFDMLKAKAVGNIRKELETHADLIETIEIPREIQLKCYAKLPNLAHPINDLPDLVILLGFVDAINLFIEFGWKPGSEHIKKTEQFYEVYDELFEDIKKPEESRFYHTCLSKQMISNTRENLKTILTILISNFHS